MPPGKRFIEWAHRANREIDADLVHRFMADVRERGDPSRATIERSVSAAIGARCTCPAIDGLFPDGDHAP